MRLVSSLNVHTHVIAAINSLLKLAKISSYTSHYTNIHYTHHVIEKIKMKNVTILMIRLFFFIKHM